MQMRAFFSRAFSVEIVLSGKNREAINATEKGKEIEFKQSSYA